MLVERSNTGRIEVWQQTDERRWHRIQDTLGNISLHETVIVQSQETDENGGRWTKEISARKLESDYQDYLAEVLAADRPIKTREAATTKTPEADETVERPHRISRRHQEILDSPRLQKLYGVQERPSDAEIPEIDYEKVFRGSDQDIADLQVNDKKRQQIHDLQQEYDRYHTPGAQKTSEIIINRLKHYDPALDKWLVDICGKDANAKVKAIALNENIRLAVAGYLREKLDYLIKENPHDIPERVARNSGKRTDAKAMPINQYNSREYVVYLALEMLSGGFEPGRSNRDPIEYGEDGRAIRGQHRDMAGQLIGYW